MAEEIESLVVKDIPVEEGAAIDADNAEDVVIDLSFLSSMDEKQVSTYRTKSSPFTICRVPPNIRECDHGAYNPRIVSIGPFHRGRKDLQAMEEHKWRYLHEVLACARFGNNLEKFLKEMKALETQSRDCYPGNIQMSSKEFVEMMMLDGCFVIFLILQQIHYVKPDDLIYDNKWMLRLIHLDLLLLENQLPFFVLECLWKLIGIPSAVLTNGALACFNYFFQYKLDLKSREDAIHDHLLHLLHLSLKPDSSTGKPQITGASGKFSFLRLCRPIRKILKFSFLRLCRHIRKILFLCLPYLINTYDRFRTRESKQKSPQPRNMIPSATELQEAGVRFKSKKATSFFEVRFEQGVMEITRLCIYDDARILFRSLMAFEQCFPNRGDHFTSYCAFIDFLVNTPRDVSILREADILENGLGSNEEVALLFNKLCKEIVWNVEESYLADLFKKVNQHTQNRWPKWRAKLVRDYISNPWAITSLIAATMILILTVLQTYFSAFDYFNTPKP